MPENICGRLLWLGFCEFMVELTDFQVMAQVFRVGTIHRWIASR